MTAKKWEGHANAARISQNIDQTTKELLAIKCLGCLERGDSLLAKLVDWLQSWQWKLRNHRLALHRKVTARQNDDLFGPLGETLPDAGARVNGLEAVIISKRRHVES